MKILITGATGFLGQYLVRNIAGEAETVYILSRQDSDKIKNMFSDFSNIKVISGDITQIEVIANEKDRKIIREEVDTILHAAALYDLGASHTESFLHNIVGTQNIVYLAQSMQKIKAFYYVSTIAVGDPESYFLEENQLTKRSQFGDFYSETKYGAEKIIRNNINNKYVTRIFRPGIIIGDSVTGEMPKKDGPYYFLDAFRKFAHLLKFLPIVPLSFNPRSKLPVIPVDHCARFMVLLIKREDFETSLKTYHLISEDIPTLKEFLSDTNKLFDINTVYLPVKKNNLHQSLFKLLGIPNEVLPFMFSHLSYDKTNTLKDLPEIKESSYTSFKHILFK